MWEQLKKEWEDDPDPTWLKVIGYFLVLVCFLMMVML